MGQVGLETITTRRRVMLLEKVDLVDKTVTRSAVERMAVELVGITLDRGGSRRVTRRDNLKLLEDKVLKQARVRFVSSGVQAGPILLTQRTYNI